MFDWLIKNWGNLLSLVGLALTVFFSSRAKSAAEASKFAAERTENAISIRSSLHALGEARRLASELGTLLGSRSYPACQVRAQDLGESLRFVSKRWGEHLDEAAIELSEVNALVDSIGEKLQVISVRNLSAAESKRLILIAQRVSNAIVSAQATVEKKGYKDAK